MDLTLNAWFWLVQPYYFEIFGQISIPVITTMNQVKVLGRFLPNPKLKLREQLAEVCRFRHFSHRTESAYWHWIKGFILFHGKRHPRELGAAEVQAYLSHLAVAKDVAAATQRWAFHPVR
jgi:hypothetical protein